MERIFKGKKINSILSALIICLIGLWVLGAGHTSIQRDGLSERIKTGLKRLLIEEPQEKVWLHLDKPYYAPGDDMWISAYLLDAVYHEPSPISKVLYIDLISPDHQIVKRLTLSTDSGRAHADIALPDSIPPGYYHLRAYTQWMRNYDENWMYHRPIEILNPASEYETAADKRSPERVFFLNFFPEGGVLVDKIPTQVAFKATDAKGNGVEVKGYIFDDQGEEITHFQSSHLGMGVFTFLPFRGKKYQARVTMGDIQTRVVPLPKVEVEGAGISIFDRNEYLQVIIRCTPELKEKPFVLAGQVRGQLCFLGEGSFSLQGRSIEIPKKVIPGGVVQFTLFDQKETALAERLVFVESPKNLKIDVSVAKPFYAKREKVTLDISTESGGQAVAASLSMAIVDQFQLPSDQYRNHSMEAYLLLSSDLQGKIEDPGYYFNPQNKDRKKALDYLMMTHGWRKFSWKKVLEPVPSEKEYLIERDLFITGEIKNLLGKPMRSQELLLSFLDGSGDVYLTESDKEGRFGFYGLTFTDTTRVYIFPNEKRDRFFSADITLNEPEKMVVNPDRYLLISSLSHSDFMRRYLENQKLVESFDTTTKEVDLETVTITGVKRDEVITIHRKATYTVEGETLPPATPLLESLQGRIPGLQILMNQNGDYTAIIRGFKSLTGSNEPLVVWDGIAVDFEAVRYLYTNDVEKVEILSGTDAAIYGSRGGNGVIAITSKKGADDRETSGPQRSFIVRGYTQVREFYVPPYDDPDYIRYTPDVRSTLYWNPIIETDSTGKAEVSFFTSDQNSSYYILIEGISADGIPGRGENSLEIR